MTRAAVVTAWVGAGTGANPNRPAVTDLHQLASWRDVTGQDAALIPHGLMPYTVEIEADDTVLDQIEADPSFALMWRGTPPAWLDAARVKAQLTNVLHADIAEWVVTNAISFEDAQARLAEAQHRAPWGALTAVAVGDVVAYGSNLYRCVQAHSTQSDWTPDVTPALWVRFHEPEDGPQPWVQPTGAHDAYQKGDRVTFQGQVYESLINANVWSPTAYPAGWELVP